MGAMNKDLKASQPLLEWGKRAFLLKKVVKFWRKIGEGSHQKDLYVWRSSASTLTF